MVKKIQQFTKENRGSMMMEYILITGVFTLLVGGVVHWDGKFANLFPGFAPNTIHVPATGVVPADATLQVPVVTAIEDPTQLEVKKYGIVGDANARRIKSALQVIAMPVP